MDVIDLNCDMGESFGAWTMGSDAEMLKIVTSANVACGFHGGERPTALAIGRAIAAIDRELIYVVMAGTELERAARELGLRMAREIYADRAYDDTGNLVSRKLPGAVLHDPEEAAARVLAMVREGAIISNSGKRIPVSIDTVCVHGDNPAAVAMAGQVRDKLEKAGIAVRPMAETRG